MKISQFLLSLTLVSTIIFANTAIETETAQLGKRGDFAISQSVELSKADDGTSGGTVTQFEYAITDRAEILVEPFFYEWEKLNGENMVGGLGDLEITPSFMCLVNKGWIPAVVLAMKVKVPTGSEEIGGTKKFDFYPYIIIGQHYSNWNFNANIGVNFTNPPGGGEIGQTLIWDLEAERQFGKKWTIFCEAYSAEDNVTTGSMAVQYQFGAHFNAFLAAAYSVEGEFTVRPGVNIEF